MESLQIQPDIEPDTRPILVPIDFSTESKAALLFANKLAASGGCPLVVLHVVHDNGNGDSVYRRNANESAMPMVDVASREMRSFIDQVLEEHRDLDAIRSARTMVVDGIPVGRILEVARNINSGHIVLGGNSRSSMSRMLHGSVSQSLVKDSQIPVTVIHANGTE